MQLARLDSGVGLGLRLDFIDALTKQLPKEIDFLEIAPENYLERGGSTFECFERLAAHYPLVTHGLALSIGSLDELNWDYLKKLKIFLRQYNIPWFTDHLCLASAENAYLHDLLPLPRTRETVLHVSERARIVQDFLEVPFGLENVSYYMTPVRPEMSDLEFIQEVLHRSGASLMLDINNIYVNSVNHGIDAKHYVRELCREKILHIHMAGHTHQENNFIIDTHGEAICADVWELLELAGSLIPLPPVVIERDTNIPPLEDLFNEVMIARKITKSSQEKKWKQAQ